MNKKELEKKLKRTGVPKHYYNLEEKGRNDERFCLERLGDKWEVYFAERGAKTTREIFDSEEEACLFLYEKLRYARRFQRLIYSLRLFFSRE